MSEDTNTFLLLLAELVRIRELLEAYVAAHDNSGGKNAKDDRPGTKRRS